MLGEDRKHAFFTRWTDSQEEIADRKADLLSGRAEAELPVEDQLAIARRQLELQQIVTQKFRETAERNALSFNRLKYDLNCAVRRATVDIDRAADEKPAIRRAIDRIRVPYGMLSDLEIIAAIVELLINSHRRGRPAPKPETVDPMRGKGAGEDLTPVYAKLDAYLKTVGHDGRLL